MPGALGLVLRKLLYPRLLGACGRNVVFGQNVVLRHPHKIRIGDNVVIDDNCLLDAKGDTNAGITIGSGVFVGRNTILSCKNGDIEIGDRREHRLQLRDVLGEPRDGGRRHAAGGVLLRDRRRSRLTPIRREPVTGAGRASRTASRSATASGWAPGAKVLDGVTIGDRAIIGAGAVVRVDVPVTPSPSGMPARIVGTRGRAPAPRGDGGLDMSTRRLNILHGCDHLGWEGSRMHGVKRLFAWMMPRFDASRFNVSLVSLRRKDLSEETLESLGVDISYLHKSKFDPATLTALLKIIDRK